MKNPVLLHTLLNKFCSSVAACDVLYKTYREIQVAETQFAGIQSED